jgi:hypothetical protein
MIFNPNTFSVVMKLMIHHKLNEKLIDTIKSCITEDGFQRNK